VSRESGTSSGCRKQIVQPIWATVVVTKARSAVSLEPRAGAALGVSRKACGANLGDSGGNTRVVTKARSAVSLEPRVGAVVGVSRKACGANLGDGGGNKGKERSVVGAVSGSSGGC
jgi:hypothetical protein